MAATWQRSISSNLKTEQVKWIKDHRLAIKGTFSCGIKWENLLTKGSQSEQRILFISLSCQLADSATYWCLWHCCPLVDSSDSAIHLIWKAGARSNFSKFHVIFQSKSVQIEQKKNWRGWTQFDDRVVGGNHSIHSAICSVTLWNNICRTL